MKLAEVRKLHFRLALAMSPFLLFMAVSGIVINHKGSDLLEKIHTGKWGGAFGTYVVDLVAIGVIATVLTGWWYYVLLRRSRRR